MTTDNAFLSKIREEAKEGLKIDINSADTCSLSLVSLQERFCRHLTTAALKLREAEKNLIKIRKEKHQWYLTEYEVRLDRKEIQDYVNSDLGVSTAEDRVAYWKSTAQYIEGILETIKQASYNLSSAIKWHIFRNGG